MYEAYVVPISCYDFDILLVSSLTSFGSAGGEALQGHSKVWAILHRGAKRAILTRVKHLYLYGSTALTRETVSTVPELKGSDY